MLPNRPFTILVAEDDEEDRLLLDEAFMQNGLFDCGRFVEDGDQVMEYLMNCIGENPIHPLPSLIIMDINMPLRNGLETLLAIRADNRLKNIPVLIMTSSRQEVAKAYRMGANSYLVKPIQFAELIQMVGDVTTYWRDTVNLPYNEY
ncbi:response regulator [Larkinella terrae]|uniref:Response regulator n=1 Tax=Larkinella terrae TaxID=2025311 RepID=A0A7K0EL73_9BACT|nr:response regulator [Larkinella terrae]MRS62559.1 response regulator [Larkinella terrae]